MDFQVFKFFFLNYQVLGISNPRIPSSGSSDRRIPGSRASEFFLDWRGSLDPAREPKGDAAIKIKSLTDRTGQIRLERTLEFSLLSRMPAGRSVRLIDFVSNLEWTSTVVWYLRQESDGGHLILRFSLSDQRDLSDSLYLKWRADFTARLAIFLFRHRSPSRFAFLAREEKKQITERERRRNAAV